MLEASGDSPNELLLMGYGTRESFTCAAAVETASLTQDVVDTKKPEDW